MQINLNKLAQKIAKKEGGKVQVNIAQIKEIQHITIVAFCEAIIVQLKPKSVKK